MATASLLIAYHADDQIARVEWIAKGAGYPAIVVLAVVLLAAVPPGAAGRNRLARVALAVVAAGIGAWLVFRVVPDDWEPVWFALVLVMAFTTFAGPVLAFLALLRVRLSDEKPLAIAAAAGSLVLPVTGLAKVIACAVTDACFH